jgi:hypothetical protein
VCSPAAHATVLLGLGTAGPTGRRGTMGTCDNLFNDICNGLVTVAEHPVLAGALALGTALMFGIGHLLTRGR